jgi:hypothetical protein
MTFRGPVIWHTNSISASIVRDRRDFSPFAKIFFAPAESVCVEVSVIITGEGNEIFEISPRFRQTIEARIARLELDANRDEARVADLLDGDHIRRHMRLVEVQRAEALRMRSFLENTRARPPRPLIAL